VEEPGASTATIKVWDGAKLAALRPPAAAAAVAAATAAPQVPMAPLKVQKLFNSKYPEAEPTALAVSDAAAPALTVAVGLGSGLVYVFQVCAG